MFFRRWLQSENILRARLFSEKYHPQIKGRGFLNVCSSRKQGKLQFNQLQVKMKTDYSSSTDIRMTLQMTVKAKVAACAVRCFANHTVWTPIHASIHASIHACMHACIHACMHPSIHPSSTEVQRRRALTSSGQSSQTGKGSPNPK